MYEGEVKGGGVGQAEEGVGDPGVVFPEQGQKFKPEPVSQGLGEEVGVIDARVEAQGLAVVFRFGAG